MATVSRGAGTPGRTAVSFGAGGATAPRARTGSGRRAARLRQRGAGGGKHARNLGLGRHGTYGARCAVRDAPVAQITRLRGYRDRRAGAGYRRDYGDFQRGERGAAASAAVCRAGPAGHGLGTAAVRAHQCDPDAEFPGLAGAQPVVQRDLGDLWTFHESGGRWRAGAGPGDADHGGVFRDSARRAVIGTTDSGQRRCAGRASRRRAELWPVATAVWRPIGCPGQEDRSGRDAHGSDWRNAGGVCLSHYARRCVRADAARPGAGGARRTELSGGGPPQAGLYAGAGAARYGSDRGANGARASADEHELERAGGAVDGADGGQIARHPDCAVGRGGFRSADRVRQRVEPVADAGRGPEAGDDGAGGAGRGALEAAAADG